MSACGATCYASDLYNLDDVVDVLGGARVARGRDDVERREVIEEQGRVLGGKLLQSHTIPPHALDDLVIHIR